MQLYDLPLAGLALMVGAVGFLSCLALVDKATMRPRLGPWPALLGAAVGLSLWSTHFIGLLASTRLADAAYALDAALSSLALGLLVIGAGTIIAVRYRDRIGPRLLGGLLVGGGAVAMHYLGLYALRGGGTLVHEPGMVGISVLVALGLGVLAIALLLDRTRTLARQAATIVLLLMALALHLLSTHATSVLPQPDMVRASAGVPRNVFAVIVALMAMKILLLGGAITFMDHHWSRQLSHQARHDALTSLPNRRHFCELVDARLDNVLENGNTIDVLTLNLDNFKRLNDVHGRAIGDLFLNTVASRIAQAAGQAGIVARLGGDDFAVMLDARRHGDAWSFAADLHERLALPQPMESLTIPIAASIGVASGPADGSDADTLLRQAEAAMGRAKADGKGQTVLFEPSLHAEMIRHRRLETRLRHALDEGGLRLSYQPLVSSGERTTVCMEALLRWNDPELGEVEPHTFIPIAESSGLIVSIGAHVLRRACRDATAWSRDMRVAVNLSPVQFTRGDLAATVSQALHDSGLPGHRLELEITESVLLNDDARTLQVIDAIRVLGVKIAMDDFGTGYSSLGYLQRFGFDKMKIDRSFVCGIDEGDTGSIGIVTAAIAMGRSLGMRVVAEGVETRAQAKLLTELECDELQGFLIARPMPSEQVNAYLLSGDRTPALTRA